MSDQESRDAILNDLDTTMLVEAAAGTGKTTNLVKRMVNVVATGRAKPATIAAITFTVKAASHLRAKLAEAPSAHADRLDTSWGEGFVGTTHAFCAQLLRERPVEAGLDPEFEELDEPAARALTSEFWNRWYDAKAVDDDPLIADARDAGLDRKTLRGAFAIVVDNPDIRLVSERRDPPDLDATVRAVLEFLDECEPHIPHNEDPDKFEQRMVKLLRHRNSLDLTDRFSQIVFLDDADHASEKPTQKRWGREIAKRLGPDYESLVLNTIRPTLRAWREYVHGVALDLLRPAAEQFADERRRNGTLTFADLLVCARDLLRDHPNVRRYFQRRFTHVFVDEFQDTDPVQAEVLMYLTGVDVEERNWRKLRPRPGSLFIVGDPKQSIYRFRRADITTYNSVKEIIERSGGRVVTLSTNFRSAPAVCEYVNDAFKTLFTKDDIDAGRQARHVDLESAVERRPSATGVFGLETPEDYATPMACAEAEVVGNWIVRNVESGAYKWSDILLVSFQRPRLRCYARVFETIGIPYEITGSKAFSEFRELEDAMPLLHAIVTPEDEVAVVAFLRGALCGADDDALYKFRKAGGRFSPFAPVPEGTDARIANGLRIIKESIDDAREHPPAAAIARVFDRIGLVAWSASGERPGTRSGNLMLALSIARDLSAHGESLGTIVDELQDLLDTDPDVEELDIDPKRENAVHLMNLHQVKGLESRVVFLIDPANEHDFDIDLFVDRSGEESLGHLVVSKEWGRGRKQLGVPRDWERLEEIEREFRRAEKKRQLYVAATRAKEMLVVGFRRSSGVIRGAWRDLAERVSTRLPWSDARPRGSTAAGTAAAPQILDIAEKFEIARRASYSVLPVTKIAHGSIRELVKAEEGLGKGTSWGRVLHRLFEAMLRDESLDIGLYARNLLKDEERDPVELEEVMSVVEAVRSSQLWSRVKSADERYVEIPFALNVPRRAVGIDEEGDTLLHGTIDLVFREGGRWFIVDYKSDSTKGRVDELVAYYASQVRYYAKFWTELTNAPATAGLFFVDGCIERWVA